MKLTHLALVLTVGLLGLTSWLAWQSHNDATGLRNQLELARIQAQGQRGAQAAPSTEAPEEIAATEAPPPPPPAPTATAAVLPPPPTAPAVDVAAKETQMLAAQLRKGSAPTAQPAPPQPTAAPAPARPAAPSLPHVNMGTSNLPPPLSPRQRQVLAMPVIAHVKACDKANGFIVIDAGKNKKLEDGMMFSLRRDNAIIGRIKVGTSEEIEAIGDIVQRSVPPGVSIEVGDEVIQDLPPET